ncbi:MAG: hypothetical protein KDK61_08580, partial [Simkania sp.]|nr:hypothetical protein [Simkania sp.]
MGNPFSSSTQSKPLRFLFLLALFVLRAGNVSSSITPSSLKHFDILKLQNPISYLPQEEPGKVSFTPTNNSLSFSFDFEEKTSVKLDIASISPNLFERPLITSKSSSLLGNNRKVIGEFIHESPSSPLLIAAPLEERTIAHPITEKKEQKKDLLSEQIASKPSLQTPSPSSILPFDHPSTSSTLIDRKFFLEKPSSSHPEKRQLPKSSSLTNSYFDNGAWIDMNHLVENNNNPLFLPSYEESSKPKLFEQIIPTPDLIFQKETLFFSEKKELFLPL